MPARPFGRAFWGITGQLRRRLDRGARREAARFRTLRRRFYEGLWASAARSVGADIESVGWGFHRIRRGDRWTLVREAEVMLDDHLRLRMAGNKLLTSRLLAERGQRVPRQEPFDLATLSNAERFLRELGAPGVVKPARESGAGQGVTTGVTTPARLRAASRAAAMGGAWDLVIEEQVPGSSFRVLVLGGRVVDAIRRDPPTVVGDGRASVRRLVARETARRLEAPTPGALHPLRLDLDADFHLLDRGWNPRTVVPAGRTVEVKNVVNQNASRENCSVLAELHPSIVSTAEDLARWLGIELAGIDLIASDVSVPLDVSGGLIGEVNTSPGLHHHYLVSDPSRAVPVAELVLEHILSRPASLNASMRLDLVAAGRPS